MHSKREENKKNTHLWYYVDFIQNEKNETVTVTLNGCGHLGDLFGYTSA